MKVFIAGSMHFAREMIEAKELLKGLGIESDFAKDTYDCLENPNLTVDEDHCFETNIMQDCMDRQKECDAILVLNHTKGGVEGYIGGHVLIELGLAYFLKQKIFLLHPPPPTDKLRHSFEVLHMRPVVLDGDMDKIKEHVPGHT